AGGGPCRGRGWRGLRGARRLGLLGGQDPLLDSSFLFYSVVPSPAMTVEKPNAEDAGRPAAGGKPVGWIGIDESGKGDYFGPLVIAAVHVTPRIAQDLLALHVRDSKKIADG